MVSESYREFRRLLREGSAKDAIELARQQLMERGGRDEFWLTHLSRAQLKAGEPREALENARRALSVDPNNAYALLARGKARRALDRFEGALSDLEEALQFPEVSKPARWALVETFVRMERWREVLDRLTEWDFPEKQTLRWRLKALTRLSRYEEARDVAERLLEIEPDDPTALWELAEVEVAERDLDSVRQRYARLARIPSRPTIYREIYASLCRRAGDEETAARQYEKIEQQEVDPRIQRKRAFTLANSGREEDALPMMEELLRSEPDDYYVHNAYAAACRRVEKLERAWEFYSELLQSHPDEKSLYGRRKKIANQLRQQGEE